MESVLKVLRTGDEAQMKHKAIALCYLATLLRFFSIPRVFVTKKDSDIFTIAARHSIKGHGLADVLVQKFYART